MFKKLQERFNLTKTYHFEINDIVALLYVIGVGLTVIGYGFIGTLILFIGAVLSFISSCLHANRFNLFIIGLTIIILDLYFLLV